MYERSSPNIDQEIAARERLENLNTEIVKLKAENENLKRSKEFLLAEYHFLSQKLTTINNVVQLLWPELRRRRSNSQTIEHYLENNLVGP